MKVITVKYYNNDIDHSEYETFINNIFLELKRFQKKNNDFTFKMIFNNDHVEIKTMKMDASKN